MRHNHNSDSSARPTSPCANGTGSRDSAWASVVPHVSPRRGKLVACRPVTRTGKTHLTSVDLFAGAGGLSLGFKSAGFRTLWAADNCAAAVQTFKHNLDKHVECVELGANSEISMRNCYCWGPSVPRFSSAGMRKIGDERNTLVSVFAQLVARTKPRAFVFENVEGFLTSERGRRVHELLWPLIRSGYRIHLRKINAANFGIPQHRKRVLAIGGLGFDPTYPEPTHSAFGAPGANLAATHLPRATTVAEAIGNLPLPTEQPPGRPKDHFFVEANEERKEKILALRPGQTMRDLPETYWHESYRRRAYRRVQDGTPTERRGGPPAGIRRLRPDEPSKAITAGASGEFIHPRDQRFLTLRECARLQTFADDFEFCGTKAERAALIGNAVPPKLAATVAQGLMQDLSTRRQEEVEGTLLSFVPALSNGISPALRHVTDMVIAEFGLPTDQLELF